MTPEQAVDEIQDIFKAAWDTTGFKAYYDDVRDQRDTSTNPYAEVVIRHASGGQRSLGGIGNRKFERVGVVIITISTLSGSGLSSSLQLVSLLLDAYEGKSTPGGVWFRNVRFNELGRDGSFYKTNVLVDFEYDQIK